MEILKYSIAGLPSFGLYLAATFMLLAVFLFVYLNITPYREIALIREGNAAAAASISGAMLGFVIPLANAVIQSSNLGRHGDVGRHRAGGPACRVLGRRPRDSGIASGIPQGKVAQGVFLGAVSVCTGILNAACITY
jgi:putative membrane protein